MTHISEKHSMVWIFLTDKEIYTLRLRENAKQPILPKWSSFIQWSMMVSIDESCNRIMLVIIILQEIHYMKNIVIFRIETALMFENIKIS